MIKPLFICLIFLAAAFSQATAGSKLPAQAGTDSLTYLAMGDSYTVGRWVSTDQSFPYRLVTKLKTRHLTVARPTLIAQNGWLTDELIKGISRTDTNKKFDFVTLLIGVNNQFQHYNHATYETEFATLLKQAIKFAGGRADHVFVLSIPDWGVTPYANGRNRDKIAAEIEEYNAINKTASQKSGVNYIDITTLSRLAADDAEMAYVASDRLHPSGKMYALWVQKIAAAVEKRFKK